MDNDYTTVFIFGERMTMTSIPYLKNMEGIFQFPNKPEYYCALQKEVIDALDRKETIDLRDDLEKILSNTTGKKMELGFATYATSPKGELAVLCYFKEVGVPQCVE